MNKEQSERRQCSRELHQIQRRIRSEQVVGIAATVAARIGDIDADGLLPERFELTSKVSAAICSVRPWIAISTDMGLGELSTVVEGETAVSPSEAPHMVCSFSYTTTRSAVFASSVKNFLISSKMGIPPAS